MVLVVKNLSRVLVSSITGHVISQHEYYPLIRYSKALNRPVNQKKKGAKVTMTETKKNDRQYDLGGNDLCSYRYRDKVLAMCR